MNVVIKNEHFREDMLHLFFPPTDIITFLPPESTMADIGVMLGMFPSKGQARKNGWGNQISDGWSEKLNVGKLKNNVWMWKPIQCTIEEL